MTHAATLVHQHEELQRSLRDLMGVLALPSLCRGRTRAEVLETVLDALNAFLPGDVAYAHTRLGEHPVERTRPAQVPDATLAQLRAAGTRPLGLEVEVIDVEGRRAVALPLGFYGDAGTIVVITDFPLGEGKRNLVLRTLSALAAAALENAQLLESLNEANRRKDNFFAVLGHELRNPLAPIATAVALMRMRQPAPDRLRDVIERQVSHMGHLIDDLLDISRITRGEVTLRRTFIDLQEVVQRATEQVAPQARERGHTLTVDVPANLVVDADPVRLAQVLANLLTNAVRYTPPPGRIHLGVADLGGRARITVTDNGRGIEAAMLERIFEPFVQADRHKDGFYGGLGLGLAIVRTLVDLHGGTVAAFSEGTGKGTEIVVELPLPSATVRATAVVAQRTQQRPRKRTVLVVDDNIDLSQLMGEVIESAGHRVVVANDAHSALAHAHATRFDVAFLDIGLPVVDGYELCASLRALGGRIHLVAVSGYGDAEARARSKQAGFDLHLMKPADPDKILAIVDAVHVDHDHDHDVAAAADHDDVGGGQGKSTSSR